MSRRWIIGMLVAVVALLAAGLVLVVGSADDEPENTPAATVRGYVEAWERGDGEAMAALVLRRRGRFPGRYQTLVEGLGDHRFHVTPGRVREGDDRAVVPLGIRVSLAGLGAWEYRSRLRLAVEDDRWWVDWSPTSVHPSLTEGRRLSRTRTWPQRAAVLAHDGRVIAGPREVVEVGVEPQRIQDRRVLFAALKEHLGLDPADVRAELERPGVQPDWFVVVATLRPEEYERVKADIYPVPGTVFRRTAARLAPRGALGAQLVGRTGEITAELLGDWKAPYVRGDVVGLSGLERVLEDELSGYPSGEVRVLDDTGKVVDVLFGFASRAPHDVRTTLDLDVQRAAEAALSGVGKPAALVALDVRTGGVRAAVSAPEGEFNRALGGRYPPGSTFKVVTAAAALQDGTAPGDPFPCPAEVEVGGKTFRNAGGEALGRVSFRDAFAHSCNTVFAPLAADLDRDLFGRTAKTFGFGVEYDLPLPSAGGRFPEPEDDTEAAAAGIGQARVDASPLHMASVAAAVASGTWRAPTLIVTAGDPGPRFPLKELVARTLRAFMRAVVKSGTGTAAAVPGKSVAGKTGTAEFGGGDPPPTHAWFIGYSGDLAVAVLVEDAGFGGKVAAPVARRFFEAL